MNTSLDNLTHKMQRAALGKIADVALSRDVALVLDAVLTDHLSAAEEGFVPQIQRGGTRHMGVGLVQHAVDEFRPLAIGVGQHLFGVLVGLVAEAAAVELLCSIYQRNDVLCGCAASIKFYQRIRRDGFSITVLFLFMAFRLTKCYSMVSAK